jgi:hypothetical protein
MILCQYGSPSGEDTVDMDEIISALGKVVAEMTYGSDRRFAGVLKTDPGVARFEEEYANSPGSDMRH